MSYGALYSAYSVSVCNSISKRCQSKYILIWSNLSVRKPDKGKLICFKGNNICKPEHRKQIQKSNSETWQKEHTTIDVLYGLATN